MSSPLLEMRGISKRFGPTLALSDVSLSISAGQVLALIGENGAGKSTLLKVLSGAHRADEGEMRLAGAAYHPRGPHDARASGIAMIYQELSLAPDLSVEDNILLGQPGTGGGLLFRRRQRERVRHALESVGLERLSPTAIVGEQSVATQQLIEVSRALASDARLILLDEPTSSLPQKDVRRLFEIIQRLRKRGLGLVYISHFLEEVREVADVYSVLRDGCHVGSGRIDDVSDTEIVSMMVGRDVDDLFPTVPHQPGEPRVEVQSIRWSPQHRGVSVYAPPRRDLWCGGSGRGRADRVVAQHLWAEPTFPAPSSSTGARRGLRSAAECGPVLGCFPRIARARGWPRISRSLKTRRSGLWKTTPRWASSILLAAIGLLPN